MNFAIFDVKMASLCSWLASTLSLYSRESHKTSSRAYPQWQAINRVCTLDWLLQRWFHSYCLIPMQASTLRHQIIIRGRLLILNILSHNIQYSRTFDRPYLRLLALKSALLRYFPMLKVLVDRKQKIYSYRGFAILLKMIRSTNLN